MSNENDTQAENTLETQAPHLPVDIVVPDQVLPPHLFAIPIPGPVLYPTLVASYVVWQPDAINTVEEVLKTGRYLGALLTKSDQFPDKPKFEDLHHFGIAMKILRRIKLPDGSVQILVQGLKRFKVKKIISEKPFPVVETQYFDEQQPEKSIQNDALSRSVINAVKELSDSHPFFNEEMKLALLNAPNSSVVSDIVAFALGLTRNDSQAFLETVDVGERFEKLLHHLRREREVAQVQKKINDEVNNKIDTLQREFFLKEQLKLIKKELGLEVDGKDQSAQGFREKIQAAKMPEGVQKIALEELEKFEALNEQSPEYNIARNYLDILCTLPWSNETEDQLNLGHASDILNQDHTGLDKVKQRIIEFLAVRNLQKTGNKEAAKKGSIILLVGPPGVGKTSVGKSIAKAMGRNFYRFSLGGMRDEAEIKGHRRTYIGAMPGKFINAAKRAGSKNAVIMLDEIDKMASHYQGDPASALLEVLDPEQNINFVDHYLDLPFDLSQMIFIATANTTQTIPAPLLDRMEVIELNSYSFEEKEQIAKKHLIPKVLNRLAMDSNTIRFEKRTLRALIQDYAREPGLRILEQLLEKIGRKVATKIIEARESREKIRLPIHISEDDLLSYLGSKRFTQEIADEKLDPGVMVGLAWTAMGGEILYIEAASMPGSGQLQLTGQMGEVMLESAKIAWSYVKKRLINEMRISPAQLKEQDIHIHIPAGAIPKDGPSAGITLASALYSLFVNQPSRSKTAMTGELSLTGKVLPIGGVREKLLAAKRAGIETVLLPKENQKDLHDLPLELLKSLNIHFASRIDEVLDFMIVKPQIKKTVKKPALRKKLKNTGLPLRRTLKGKSGSKRLIL